MPTKLFYEDLISKKIDKNKLLDNLYKPVKKNKGVNQPHFYSYDKNVIHQADLLFLPNDNGYKYALVVTDLHDRATNARPLKSKKAEEIIEAFEDIYKSKFLSKPKRIIVDAGHEFMGDTQKWFEKNGIDVKRALPGRHSQVGIVENKNLVIGKALLKRQTGQEILTGLPSTEWIDDLPEVIKVINDKAKPVKEKNISNEPICQGQSCILLEIGDLVRIALDEPRAADESNQKLYGKFRASDLRWEIKPRKIENIYLNPGMPPMYKVEGKPSVAYTRNQLQLVNSNEKPPSSEFLRGNQNIFKVQEIIDKKTIKGKNYYLVHWEYHDNPKDFTWEEESKLKNDVPKIVINFEIKLKKAAEVKQEPKKLSQVLLPKNSKTRTIKIPKKLLD